MLLITLCCLTLVSLTTLLHYEALGLLNRILPRLQVRPRARLVGVILGTFVSHVLQMLLYGLAFYVLVQILRLGQLAGAQQLSLRSCMYFSMENYTSLGFGDIVPHGPVRMLVGIEALNGLLLIGWSASYTYLAMDRFWGLGSGNGNGNGNGNGHGKRP